jgi:hypothetical protein
LTKTPSHNRRVPAWTTLLGHRPVRLALFWLHHVLGQYRWQDILGSARHPARSCWRRGARRCAGYGCLTLYDAWA